tara:strand:+ start:766 stop:1032 length:267 start_codon:yes stop_codon:yes gene_type:complete
MSKPKLTWVCWHEGRAQKSATTKRELVWLMTSGHMDERKRVISKGDGCHLFYYTAPRGEFYTITREDLGGFSFDSVGDLLTMPEWDEI